MTDPVAAGSGHRRAVLFPGQGSQFVGMAADLVDSYPVARSLFEDASDRLGEDLLTLCASGPKQRLNDTDISQPAIFVASMAVLRVLEQLGGGHLLQAQATAGLSLGEYSALVFAGSLRFEDALEVVVARGRAMQRACDRVEGTMSSILGLELPQVREAVEAGQAAGVVTIANVNASTQIVISGEIKAVRRAAEVAQEMGARRVIELEVAGAYHSPLMAGATEQLTPVLEALDIERPRIPFYPNVVAEPVDEPRQIRECLVRQVESSVLWQPTLQALVDDGLDEVIEPGPGRVVAGLLKQVDRGIPTHSILNRESIEEILEGTVS
ncbi:MAG: ACP S-malonyltransferase [Planctomycetota bacterium]|nr:ACP S-malonyltransferase [Planctomycetota bacterium]